MLKRGFLLFLFTFFVSAAAQASEWIVERTTQNVSISSDGTSWHSVQVGEAIPNAYWVRTGARARVILAKGSERIMYRENTVAAISVSQPTGRKTQVTQRRGSVLLSVQKRRRQHTSVVTPHLAAVVKGTVFEVTVGRAGSNVRVDRGLVQVSDGNQSTEVPAGRVATAGAATSGIDVANANSTSLTDNGTIGLELAEIQSNGNAGGNGNGGGSSNAGGNGNGNGGGSSNAGGNGNGNGGGGSNAGGNENGNGGGSSNAGGNGNGNGGGSSNAGGNGNGNGGGNSNAGGNGNGGGNDEDGA